MLRRELRASAACLMILLAMAAAADATAGCTTTTGKQNSPFFGATPSKPSWSLYTQETTFRTHGDITKINAYYSPQEKCVRGIKPTFGYDAKNAARMGVEKDAASNDLASVDLKLRAGEVFVKADWKASSTCIEFIRLTTNKARQLELGNTQSTRALQTSAPVSGGFLGFFNGYTDAPNASAKTGNLQQLQVVWATRVCSDSTAPSPAPVPSPAVATPPMTSPSPSPAVTPASPSVQPPPAVATSPAPSPATTPAGPTTLPSSVGPVCKPASLCYSGKCPTSTCALNGLGIEVLELLCYATNEAKNVDATVGNPCRYLACKLDTKNCKSGGLLGVGGFCTGTVTAVADKSKLHPLGLPWLGYPCVEHTGPVLDVLTTLSATSEANGTYSQTAWKACNCLGSDEPAAGGSNGLVFNFTLPPPLLSVPALTDLVKKPVINMTTIDVLAQWIAANQLTLPVPHLPLAQAKVAALKALIPGFVVPSLLVPNVSLPLLKAPPAALKLSIPVFAIPAAAQKAVSQLLPNLTALPSLVSAAGAPLITLPRIQLPNITAPNFLQLAKSLVTDGGVEGLLNSLPSLPGILNALQSLKDLLPPQLSGIDFAGLAALVPAGGLNITALGDALNQVTSFFASVMDKLGISPATAASSAKKVAAPADSTSEVADDDDDASEALPEGASAATAFMAPADFAALSAGEQQALLALYG